MQLEHGPALAVWNIWSRLYLWRMISNVARCHNASTRMMPDKCEGPDWTETTSITNHVLGPKF